MQQPTQAEVEVFDDAVNAWVVRTPGRQFPGVVVQGDDLNDLFGLAQTVLDSCRSITPHTQLARDAERLRDLLWDRLRSYEEALTKHELRLPYSRSQLPA